MEDKNINPNAQYNPSSGLQVRNPTHQKVADKADDQREIVETIKQARAQRMKAIYDYDNPKLLPGLPGLIKIREMSEEQIVGFCRTLMRAKPNIIGIELSLGDYPDAKECRSSKLALLNSRKPRNPTEVAADVAELFNDPTLNIVNFEYKINSATPGLFESIARAKVVSDESYADNSKFRPHLEIEYIAM